MRNEALQKLYNFGYSGIQIRISVVWNLYVVWSWHWERQHTTQLVASAENGEKSSIHSTKSTNESFRRRCFLFFFYCQQTTNDSYKFFTEEKKCLDNSGVHLAEMNGEGIKMLSSLRHPLKSRGERCRAALKISEQVLIASQVSECPKIIKDVGMTLLLV